MTRDRVRTMCTTVLLAGTAAVLLLGGARALFDGGSAVAAPICTINFSNTSGGDFSTAANWTDATSPTTHRVPGTSDYACVPSSITGKVTYATGASTTIAGISAQGTGGLSISSGTLTLSDSTQPSAIAALTMSNGTIAGAGSLTLSGATTWSGGTISNTGGVTVASATTVTTTTSSPTLDTALTNKGIIDVSAGGITFSGGSVLTNASTGIINLNGNAATLGTAYGASGSVTNSGTIDATAGTGSTDTIEVALTTSLAGFDITSGAVSMTGGGTLSGSGSLPSGTILSFDDGSYALSGVTISGAGTTRIQDPYGANWQLTGSNSVSSLFTMSNGTIAGAGSLTLSGATTWSGGTISNTGGVTVASATTVTTTTSSPTLDTALTNKGIIDVSAGGITFSGGSVLTNASTGIINLNGNAATLGTAYGASGSVTNSGTIDATAGTGNTDTIEVPESNLGSGTLEVDTGTLSVSTLANLASGTLTGGTYVASGVLKLSGPATTNAAVIDVPAGGEVITGASNALAGLATNSGTLTLGASLTVSGALANSGTVTLDAGTLDVTGYSQSAGVTTVNTGATLATASGSGPVTITAGTLAGSGSVIGALSGAGAVQPSGSSGPLAVTGTYAPASTGVLSIEVGAPNPPATGVGEVTVSGSATLAGTLAVSTAIGYKPTVGSTYTVLSASSVTGTFAGLTGQIDQSAGIYYTVSYTSTSVVLTVKALPKVSIASATTTSPTTGTSTLAFKVSLSAANPFATSVKFATANGTALSGTDYSSASGKLTIAAGKTSGTVDVTVLAQSTYGPTKTFTVTLSAPTNALPGGTTATGTLANPYPEPSLSVANASVTAPTSGTTPLDFTVTLSAPSQLATSVQFATADGTATAGTDYSEASGMLTIPAGATSGTVAVTVLAQTTYGPTTTFSLILSSPTKATISQATATGSILNPIPPPPAPSSVNPSALGRGASKAVVITGAQFAAGSTVVVSGKGVTVSTVTVVSATTIDATFKVASTAALGLRNVSVTDTDGTGTCSNCLSIDVAPSLTGASPSGVAAGAAGQVTFTGTNFVAGSVSVSFVEAGTAVKATAVTVVSASTITAKVTVGATATLGAYEVKVTNPDGGVGTCDACFSIIAPPTVTGLSTPSVAPGSTTSETITGTGFVAGATVKGPNTKVTFSNVTVVNSTTITATMTVVVGAAPGTGLDVTVTDPAAGGYGVGSGAVLTVT